MSPESPKPPSLEIVKQTTEELVKFVQWVGELIRGRNWFTLLLLVDAVLLLFFTPGGIFSKALESLWSVSLPEWYGIFFLTVWLLIALLALIIAVVTRPPETEEDQSVERKAIKGLRPFTLEDAEIFKRLQREWLLNECLETITYDSFSFGILMGLSGCGKTICDNLRLEVRCQASFAL
ncbi:hypothetical protein [Crocosphaera sp. Alani8]|uniref:hypothetical protein n=1 Tax=Crocosphaera sp. Alani8 TaxID=3038952 RepID=UPI00313DE83A